MTGPGDRSLVDAIIQSGDRNAFGALYDRHTPYLYRFALRLCGADEAIAQDIVHDAWVAATSRFASFEWKAGLRTWLAGFVLNGARAALRADYRTSELSGTAAMEDSVLAGVHDRVDLERGIAALPPAARHVFVLHDVEGWTHDDIGRLLGIEPGTSKSQLSRARALLRKRLAAAGRNAS
ncbi:MAG: RNA polymerase sigma factor [Gemmatimonadetes bacterium]|nr:RNA polymerase sigma factor [Gemmatimonadota bacterium]